MAQYATELIWVISCDDFLFLVFSRFGSINMCTPHVPLSRVREVCMEDRSDLIAEDFAAGIERVWGVVAC